MRLCRHPGAGCRYQRDGLCTIDEATAQAIAEDLAQQILQRETAVPPAEYRVAV